MARALINQPKLILADEPTGNLDETNEQIVLRLLRELHAEGHTILMVTHAPSIGRLADRRIDLAHGRLAEITVAAVIRAGDWLRVVDRYYGRVIDASWSASGRKFILFFGERARRKACLGATKGRVGEAVYRLFRPALLPG